MDGGGGGFWAYGLNYTLDGGILDDMAVKKAKNLPVGRHGSKVKEVIETPVVVEKKEEDWGEPLDPQEEKVLDWILKGVVAFVLGWLGLSILLVIGGYFHLWG